MKSLPVASCIKCDAPLTRGHMQALLNAAKVVALTSGNTDPISPRDFLCMSCWPSPFKFEKKPLPQVDIERELIMAHLCHVLDTDEEARKTWELRLIESFEEEMLIGLARERYDKPDPEGLAMIRKYLSGGANRFLDRLVSDHKSEVSH